MSDGGDDLLNGKRENFKTYLNKFGVIEALTNVLAKIYELDIKPTDPLDYIRTNMTETIHEREELKILKTKHENILSQIQKMKEENINLAKVIKELENYGEELRSKSKLETDENAIGVEE